jgi:PAS domain S-box-containing protein
MRKPVLPRRSCPGARQPAPRSAPQPSMAEVESARALSLLTATLESTADGILVVDLEGRIALFNHKFAQMWRLPAELLASRDNEAALQFVLGQLKDPDRFLSRSREIFERPESDGFDVLEFNDGRVFERWTTPQRVGQRIIARVSSFRDVTSGWAWLTFTALPLRDPATGGQTGAVVTFVDITERARTEERLNTAEVRFRRLVETVKAVVWSANPETFQFTYVNPEAERVLGYPARQWIEEPKFWLNHLHPDDATWAPGFCLAATRDWREHEFEYRMIAADGRVVWLHDLVSFVTRPDGSREMVGVMVDITESKQTAEALRESEERFRQIAENQHDVLWVVDAECQRITYINPAYERIWGQTCETLFARMESFMDSVVPEDRAVVLPMLEGNRRGDFKSTEYRIRRRDGPVPWIRDRAFPIFGADGPYADRALYPLPTVVLLDLKLPKRCGHEVIERLRRQPGLKRLPVIALSTSEQPADVDLAHDLGVNSHIVKPVQFDDLLDIVRALDLYWFRFNHGPRTTRPDSAAGAS